MAQRATYRSDVRVHVLECGEAEEQNRPKRNRRSPPKGCRATCVEDPLTLELIDASRLVRIGIGNGDAMVCYDVKSLYDFLLTRNMEPTSRGRFSQTDLDRITALYKNQVDEDAADLVDTQDNPMNHDEVLRAMGYDDEAPIRAPIQEPTDADDPIQDRPETPPSEYYIQMVANWPLITVPRRQRTEDYHEVCNVIADKFKTFAAHYLLNGPLEPTFENTFRAFRDTLQIRAQTTELPNDLDSGRLHGRMIEIYDNVIDHVSTSDRIRMDVYVDGLDDVHPFGPREVREFRNELLYTHRALRIMYMHEQKKLADLRAGLRASRSGSRASGSGSRAGRARGSGRGRGSGRARRR